MRRAAALLAVLLLAPGAAAELRGHGGPVRALAAAPDGRLAVSGGFDQSAILWDLARGAAVEVWRFHDGAVNAVAALADGRFASAGEDGRIALWRAGEPAPVAVITAHEAPIAALAISPDGAFLASASWDETVRLTPLDGGAPRSLAGHRGNVLAVAVARDGTVVSAGVDASVRTWRDGAAVRTVQVPTALSTIALAPDGAILVGGADGVIRLIPPGDAAPVELAHDPAPIVALAVNADGSRIAVSRIRGPVVILDRAGTAVHTLSGAAPVTWSLAFTSDGATLLTGGGDRVVRRWNVATGAELGGRAPAAAAAADGTDRGAVVFRACEACHTLTADGGNRAGPTLHGVFGRRVGTAPGYNFSPALRAMDIVWTAETIARLFEIGPATFTPGTKMPEQTIGDGADREALVRFLERATR